MHNILFQMYFSWVFSKHREKKNLQLLFAAFTQCLPNRLTDLLMLTRFNGDSSYQNIKLFQIMAFKKKKKKKNL